ncbi:MAG: lytic transglycosylase domain-containing protein, partial [Rhodospirillales bacterium]|nr:lytic transglycosylase domain-containing protein [Rhodospirillales bacterium]
IAVSPPIAGTEARGQIVDRDFLAGFLLLRFLNQPQEAATWFQDLASSSTAAISQGRAYYWLGRSENGAAAQQDYARAAAYPDTFYGQLASLALGESPQILAQRIKSVAEPNFSVQDALDFGLGELPRAAVLLVQMNDPHDAAIFLDRIGQTALDDKSRLMAARLALGLGFPQSAVAIARLAGVSGQMLVNEGWPIPYNPPASILDPAISLGIMRQESSFNPIVVSGAGAVLG